MRYVTVATIETDSPRDALDDLAIANALAQLLSGTRVVTRLAAPDAPSAIKVVTINLDEPCATCAHRRCVHPTEPGSLEPLGMCDGRNFWCNDCDESVDESDANDELSTCATTGKLHVAYENLDSLHPQDACDCEGFVSSAEDATETTPADDATSATTI